MFKLFIKLQNGTHISGTYGSLWGAYNAADSYNELAKKCQLTGIVYVNIEPVKP